MKINRRGITRTVFVFKDFVVKVPNWRYSWEHFLKGLIANIHENKTWKFSSGKYEQGKSFLLCPVLWCSWGGWILIMKRADVDRYYLEHYVLTDKEETPRSREEIKEENHRQYQTWIDAGFGGDDKADNYGYLNGRLVKVDYAS